MAARIKGYELVKSLKLFLKLVGSWTSWHKCEGESKFPGPIRVLSEPEQLLKVCLLGVKSDILEESMRLLQFSERVRSSDWSSVRSEHFHPRIWFWMVNFDRTEPTQPTSDTTKIHTEDFDAFFERNVTCSVGR